MKLHDLDFHIYSEDKPLPEYQTKTDASTKTITSFIPSHPGKEFQIRWTSQRTEHLRVICRVDGHEIVRKLTWPSRSGCTKGIYVAADQVMPLVFSNLVLLDDDSLVQDSSTTEKLGTIEMEVIRVIRRGPSESSPSTDFRGVGPVHEKSKKVGGHCVSFGKARPCAPSAWATATTMHPAEGHWAKFVFQYRPEGILRAQGIIEEPQSPEPVGHESIPKAIKRSRSAAPAGENPQQNASSSSLERSTKRVKTESQDDNLIDLTQVGEDPPKLLDPSLRGTVIDLTLDD
ncbi:hypothetical protein QCA50_004929 [Cerrena zonata]|uniref:DUF7918 domain-containing protein n=1 Tax=Cerrena zonata TaxID=2478898 RepID=A0AAW0GE03_9APHY